MKTLLTTFALASALVSGSAAAATVSVELNSFDGSTAIESNSHYSSKELVNIDGANLPHNNYGSDLYIGSK